MLKKYFRKIVDAIFGKRCECKSKIVCTHENAAVRKEVKYCSLCKTILNEG